jgi:hypothetical protein
MDMTEFAKITDAQIDAFCTKLTAMKLEHTKKHFAKLAETEKTEYAYEKGRKYIRIVEVRNGNPGSVYCFLDFLGNIWKAASWKTPELNRIRGHISDETIWTSGALGPYGPAYLTGQSYKF